MKFEWDPEKEKANRKKHRVGFVEACYIFADESLLSLFDEDHSNDEDRWITIGQTTDNKILVVVHTFRDGKDGETIRLISAREALKHEERQYFERRKK